MSYNTVPDAEYVRDFARRMQSRFSRQDTVDKAVMELEAMTQPIAAAKVKGQDSTPGRALRSGLWNQLVRRDAATVTMGIYIRFNPPDPTDDDDRKHASLLEAWVNSGLLLSGLTAEMNELLARSLIGYGRNWTNFCHDPRVWADDDMKQVVDRYAAEEDEKEREAIKKDIDAYKRDRWPFRLRYVDPIGTYGYGFDPGVRRLAEVVECRKMTADDIENEYGAKAIPAGTKKGDTELEVYPYANHFHEATVIGVENPVLAHTFQHDLGRSPYTLEESNLIPVNQYGVRWFPALYHAKGLIEVFDRVLSDWETNTHENALGTIIEYYDPNHLEVTAEATGRPKVQVLKAGSQIAMLMTEKVEKGPVFELTQEHGNFRNFLYNLIEQNAIQPVLQGETKSGDSQTLIASSVGLAERKFSPAVSARKAGYEDRAEILMRGVGALNKAYPNSPDKVWVFDNFKGKGAIGVGPKDLLGWEKARQARGEPAIPLDDNRKWAVAQIKINAGVPESQVFEEMGYEDPEAMIRQGFKEQARRAAFEQVGIPTFIQRATQQVMQPKPAEQQQLAQMQGTGSPGLEQFMQMMQGGGGTMPPGMGANGNLMQAASNMARTGVPQAPQLPQ